jgi:aldehyde dehydrogenase (NAD+)
LAAVLLGGAAVGEALVDHPDVKLVSATGSTRMGRLVGERCARRFKRSLLELGGNNAGIVCPSANLELALRSVTFSAVGTAGQRCTSLRRLIVHDSLYEGLVSQLQEVYATIPVGDPYRAETLVGPLIDSGAYRSFAAALAETREHGGKITGGARELGAEYPEAYYVRPALVEMPRQDSTVLRETFAPILYVMRYHTLEQALELNNAADHGLSSAIFTQDLCEAETFLAAGGSDCGIANVNIGTSGAEIGGAFGGEKDTGGGREAGSDSWKAYMRRATNTINYGSELPLAQGIRFDITKEGLNGRRFSGR